MSGGALSINGKQSDKFKTMDCSKGTILIKNSIFDQNYAGLKASSINLIHVKTSKVELNNLTVTNNTGSFSFFEVE